MKHNLRTLSILLAGTMLLSGCSGSAANTSNSSESILSSSTDGLINVDFSSEDLLKLMGSSKREIAEKYNISNYEDSDELTAVITYNNEFNADVNFKFIESQLNKIRFNFDVSDLSNDDVVYIYNSLYKDLSKYYGEQSEVTGTNTVNDQTEKISLRNWYVGDSSAMISRHYSDNDNQVRSLTLTYEGAMKDTSSGSYRSSCVYFTPSPSCDVASSNWGDDLKKVLLFNYDLEVEYSTDSVVKCNLNPPVEGFDTTVSLSFVNDKLCSVYYFISSSDPNDQSRVIEVFNGLASYLTTLYDTEGSADYESEDDLLNFGKYSVLWKTDKSIVIADLTNEEDGASIILSYSTADESFFN